VPTSIRIDCEPNASAGLRHGLWSLFSRDLTLTIGLPLVAGLNLRQFTGVMAHEFGHFSQGFGMRVTALIRSINFWFARAAYDRDRWDDYLVRACEALPIRLGIFLYVVRLFVWLARQMIAGVMWIGHAIGCSMLRQMEYDADRYETRMVGSRTFASTCSRLGDIMLAHQMALSDLSQFWNEGRLPDNLPVLVASNIPNIPPRAAQASAKV
jgi:Zn-dependent protease with chaperone function